MPIELRDMLERRREVTFQYFGNEIHIEYWVDKLTKEFRAEILRLVRRANRIQQTHAALTAQIESVEEDADTPEGQREDAAAEAAIKQLLADDAIVKGQIDAALLIILASWDVVDKGKPVPITLETLDPIAPDFESEIINAIFGTAAPQGEASGQGNMKPLPFSSKRKAKLASSRRPRSG